MTHIQHGRQSPRLATALVALGLIAACGGGPGQPVRVSTAGEQSNTRSESTGRGAESSGYTSEPATALPDFDAPSVNAEAACTEVCARISACSGGGNSNCVPQCLEYAAQASTACFAAALDAARCVADAFCQPMATRDAVDECEKRLPKQCQKTETVDVGTSAPPPTGG